MSDTPRTDVMVTGNSDPTVDEYEDLAGFTRQLERELATERAAREQELTALKLKLEVAKAALLFVQKDIGTFDEVEEALAQLSESSPVQVLLTKEQEPRTRTLLRSMLAAFDRGDSDTYWATFGMLLEVHKEVMSADTKGTST